MNFPRSTQYITQAVPMTGSPYGNNLVSMYITNGDPETAIYNLAEANTVAYMGRNWDDGRGFGAQSYYNMMGNMGSMLSGGTNRYTYYPREPRMGFVPAGFPYQLLMGNGSNGMGVPPLYNYGFARPYA
jgi:hypothetical protein